MDSPPQFAVIAFAALAICAGPVLLTAGILAYSGRWTSWAGPSSYPSTAKHSRLGFMMFWAGLPMTAVDILLGLEVLGVDPGVTRGLMLAPAVFCMTVVMIHIYFLPKFLRPLLLPRWYREWEAAQFELEERNEERRRARRSRRRDKRRREKEKARLLQAKAAAREEKRRARMQQAAP
ncbi:hypothetical protein [Arthrobacter sp. zg-Y1116]|uniref:hypothetical protein n=1 Tax=Arthrobacter sp. zg-Y1116 TaxID=2964611 RepID=UPI0021020894|nr:hypothetical protein [Arthrobacter sp. zg-Y1116]MCQ1945935.1 hypothetical protein [Arthrobacter sp. zg-Y1116]